MVFCCGGEDNCFAGFLSLFFCLCLRGFGVFLSLVWLVGFLWGFGGLSNFFFKRLVPKHLSHKTVKDTVQKSKLVGLPVREDYQPDRIQL